MSEQPRIRRNIDTLTPEELADYQHAFAKLIEISDDDPDSIDGYIYLKQLHDGSLGPSSTPTTPSCRGTAHTCTYSRRRCAARTRRGPRT